MTLSVNSPSTLFSPSTLVKVLAEYLGEIRIVLLVIIVSVHLLLIVCMYVIRTNTLIKRYNNKIDLCEEIKNILQREDNVMENKVDENDITNTEKEQVLSSVKIENV